MKRRSFLRGLAATLALPFLPRLSADACPATAHVRSGGLIAYWPSATGDVMLSDYISVDDYAIVNL